MLRSSSSVRAVVTSVVILLACSMQSGSAADDVRNGRSDGGSEVLEIKECQVTPENYAMGFGAEFETACQVNCFQEVCQVCKHIDNVHTRPYEFCRGVEHKFESASALDFNHEAATSSDCASRVASGDRSVGISAKFDASCATGGIGCFGTDRCRYCRETATKQSESFVPCSEPSSTPQSPCAAAASSSGLADVSFVTDAFCQTNPRLAGCIAAVSSCRLCRNTKNEGNQYLLTCKILRERQQLTASTGQSTAVTAMTKSSAYSQSSSTGPQSTMDFAAAGAGAAVGAVVALAIVAVRKSQTHRSADAAARNDSTALQRVDSILSGGGRDCMTTL